jgi:hypothetical protein
MSKVKVFLGALLLAGALAPAWADAQTQTVTVDVTWQDIDGNEDGYNIYQCVGVGCVPLNKLGIAVPANATKFTDTLRNDPGSRVIGYSVAAFNKGGEAPRSAPVYITTPMILLAPKGPSGVNAVVIGVSVP